MWTNPSPTSNFANGNLAVTGSDNYTILAIKVKPTKDDTEQYAVFNIIDRMNPGELVIASSTGEIFRTFGWESNNTMTFNNGGKSGVGFDNKYCIPLKIYGLV